MRTVAHYKLRDAITATERVKQDMDPWPLWFECLWWIAAGGLVLVGLWGVWAMMRGIL